MHRFGTPNLVVSQLSVCDLSTPHGPSLRWLTGRPFWASTPPPNNPPTASTVSDGRVSNLRETSTPGPDENRPAPGTRGFNGRLTSPGTPDPGMDNGRAPDRERRREVGRREEGREGRTSRGAFYVKLSSVKVNDSTTQDSGAPLFPGQTGGPLQPQKVHGFYSLFPSLRFSTNPLICRGYLGARSAHGGGVGRRTSVDTSLPRSVVSSVLRPSRPLDLDHPHTRRHTFSVPHTLTRLYTRTQNTLVHT